MKAFGKIFGYIVLIIAAFLSLFPFYFMFVSGTNTNNQILSVPPKLSIGSELAANLEHVIYICCVYGSGAFDILGGRLCAGQI